MPDRVNKILCVHSGGSTLRGSEWALLDILTELSRLGKKIRLLCDQKTLFDKAVASGMEAELIPYGVVMLDASYVALHPIKLARANWAVFRNIKSFRPDVVYCNAARSLQMSLLASKVAGVPTIVHLHSPYNKRYLYGYGTTMADMAIHCSEKIKIQHEQKVKFRKSVTLRNAVQVEHTAELPKIIENKVLAPFVIGFFGSLIPRKGLDILIAAVDLLLKDGIHCRLKIGGHEHNGSYRDQVNKLGIEESVDFVGEISRNRISDFFKDINIHVLPSRSDAMPLSIIEAAMCGVPTIAHDVGGVSESLLEGRLGILYSDNKAETLFEIIRTAAKNQIWTSPSECLRRAEVAREAFSLSNNALKLASHFESVAVSRGR